MKHPARLEGCSVSYGDVLEAWLTSSKLNTKESTYARYSHLIRTHINPNLGSYQISKITTQNIEEFAEALLVAGRLDNGGGLAPKTVADILTIVKSSFEYARFMNLTVVCNLSRLTIKKDDKEMRVLTTSEQRQLVTVLMEDMDRAKFGVLLSLHTGIRIICCRLYMFVYLLVVGTPTIRLGQTWKNQNEFDMWVAFFQIKYGLCCESVKS